MSCEIQHLIIAQVGCIILMWIFLIYQASTVEDVLEKLNRLSESIDVLQGDSNSIRETEKSDVTEMKDMIDSLNAESRSILERVEDMDRMSTRFVMLSMLPL